MMIIDTTQTKTEKTLEWFNQRDAEDLVNTAAIEVYSADMDILFMNKIPYSSRYTLGFVDREELVEVSNGIVRVLDTWRTEQEGIDKANSRVAKCGLGCFPIMHICPICSETFTTSSSLPLQPGVVGLDSEGRVAHSHCLAGTEKCYHKDFIVFWYKSVFKEQHLKNLMAACSTCELRWHLKETAENIALVSRIWHREKRMWLKLCENDICDEEYLK